MFSPNAALKFLPAALFAAVVLTGCTIDVKDRKNGEGEKRVDIQTPVGGIHVNEQADVRDTGLTVYPGAKPAQKENSDDTKSANVNISGPGFGVRVVAMQYMSDEAPEKIIAYYDKELQKFGKVVQCHGHWKGGSADIGGGKHDGSKPVSCSGEDAGSSIEMKVGTEDNQHIVAIDRDGNHTKFALVYVRTHGKGDTI